MLVSSSTCGPDTRSCEKATSGQAQNVRDAWRMEGPAARSRSCAPSLPDPLCVSAACEIAERARDGAVLEAGTAVSATLKPQFCTMCHWAAHGRCPIVAAASASRACCCWPRGRSLAGLSVAPRSNATLGVRPRCRVDGRTCAAMRSLVELEPSDPTPAQRLAGK